MNTARRLTRAQVRELAGWQPSGGWLIDPRLVRNTLTHR